MEYKDFEVTILPRQEDRFPVRIKSPAGDDHDAFSLPFDEQDLAQLLPNLSWSVARGTTRVLRGDAPPPEKLTPPEVVGGQLFESLFSGRVRSLFERSMGMLYEQPNIGLRIKLRIDPDEAPELAQVAGLPWEYLYQQDTREFLSLSMRTPVVRYLEVPRPPEPLKLDGSLRILFVLASPQDQVSLDLEGEKQRIEKALGPQREAGNVAFEFVEGAGTMEALRRKLDEGTFHVIHFMGHGDFDPSSGEGQLCFETGERGTDRLSARKLTTLLRDYGNVRLVFLNACQTAVMTGEGERNDAFMGVAPALVMGGMTAVIAMQFPISDEAAQVFSGELYSQLARGAPVDEAMSKARQAVQVGTDGQEWGTPVLFMRAPDGKVFDRPVHLPDVVRLGTLTLPRKTALGIGAGVIVLVLAAVLGLVLLCPRPSAYLALVLDNGPDGGAHGLEEIKAVLREELVGALPEAALALYTFGERCGDTQRPVSLSRGNADRVARALAEVQPVARADLVEAIRQALDDVLQKPGEQPRAVIVVTWGVDGCGGDLPAALAAYRQQLGSAVNLYLINLGDPLPGVSQAGVQNNVLTGIDQAQAELARILAALARGQMPGVVPSPAPMPTSTPTLIPSSTATGTSTPTGTWTPTPTVTWTSTPTPTSSRTPTLTPRSTLPRSLDHPWNAAWKGLSEDWKEKLGSPIVQAQDERLTCIRQQFERGFMFWCDRQPKSGRPNMVFAIEQGGENRAWHLKDTWIEAEGQVSCLMEVPELKDRFRKVWCEQKEIRDALRLPLENEWTLYKVELAPYGWGPGVKEFEGGYILWDTYTSKLWVLSADWKSFPIGPGTITPSPTSTFTPTPMPSDTPTPTDTFTPTPTGTAEPSPTP